MCVLSVPENVSYLRLPDIENKTAHSYAYTTYIQVYRYAL